MKLFFEEINNLKDIEKLQKFKDYLNIEWKTVFDIDILLNKIDELIHNIIINEQTLFNEKKQKAIIEAKRIEKENEIKKLQRSIIEKENEIKKLQKAIIEAKRIEKENEIKKRREARKLAEIKEKEDKLLNERLNSNNYNIYGDSGRTFQWLVNNSMFEINTLLKNKKITPNNMKI